MQNHEQLVWKVLSQGDFPGATAALISVGGESPNDPLLLAIEVCVVAAIPRNGSQSLQALSVSLPATKQNPHPALKCVTLLARAARYGDAYSAAQQCGRIRYYAPSVNRRELREALALQTELIDIPLTSTAAVERSWCVRQALMGRWI